MDDDHEDYDGENNFCLRKVLLCNILNNLSKIDVDDDDDDDADDNDENYDGNATYVDDNDDHDDDDCDDNGKGLREALPCNILSNLRVKLRTG